MWYTTKRVLKTAAWSFLATLVIFALGLALLISPIMWGWTGLAGALFVVMWVILACLWI